MRSILQVVVCLAAFGVACFWMNTFAILGDAPLLDGPRDEADRALAFFLRRTAISFALLVALFVGSRFTRLWADGSGAEVKRRDD